VKTGWNSMRIMCQSGYSRNVVSASLNFKYPTKRVDLVLSGYHHLIDIAGHRPTERGGGVSRGGAPGPMSCN
jgi:hypothetical protein